MTVIVVSNRVARAKSDEPVAGGLATALIPMVKDSGAIWVGSSGQAADSAPNKGLLRPDRGARHRRARNGRHAGETLSRLL